MSVYKACTDLAMKHLYPVPFPDRLHTPGCEQFVGNKVSKLPFVGHPYSNKSLM